MAANNMNNLTTLIKRYRIPSYVHLERPCISHRTTADFTRLEAATSRLEDIASSTLDASSTSKSTDVPQMPRSSSAIASSGPPPPQSQPTPPSLPPSVEAFDNLINSEVKKFATLSQQLDDLVKEQVNRVIL